MIYVIGGRGRLGRAICASRPADITALDRAVYAEWWRDGAAGQIARFFAAAEPGSIVLVTAGVLDPALPAVQHQRVNFELPARIIDGACKAGLRVVTFGTVMERLVAHPNAYIATKAMLGRHAAERAAAGDAVTHLQVHTLYGGGEPAPFMFLGQLCCALREGRPFEMSPGRQLREYHHVDDDVAAVHAVLVAGETGIVTLSHGDPCTLRDLAEGVFAAVGRGDLLRIGARPEPPDDNYATMLPRPQVLENLSFRPALEGVSDYVKAQLSKPQQQA
ncbi:NAD-dependent epimerase/dehydratase family protein [Variovorax guangxiensis]|uniref:NAD-dependent epimerase/dehydratase family protein n=1 Tax=Variovorax guangxiensis TaxID=1775474 RepID=UPI0028634D7F|nr:NAD-dependent epimerase/dehydratase family protein [Variovorax guangxiensis]MDR6857583.1 nucleoside-diphosphate-sugar epimerase [Variovorax guangxiensis]